MSHVSMFLTSMLTLRQHAPGTNLYPGKCHIFRNFAIGWLPFAILPFVFLVFPHIHKHALGLHTHARIFPLVTHACESNYQLSLLVKKIQISIIESRWCGSMSVWGGGEGARYRTFVPEWGLCYEVKWALHGASWWLIMMEAWTVLSRDFQ